MRPEGYAPFGHAYFKPDFYLPHVSGGPAERTVKNAPVLEVMSHGALCSFAQGKCVVPWCHILVLVTPEDT